MVSDSSSASSSDWAPTSPDTFWNAASTDMPDCTQISSMSSESGKAFLIEVWRRCTRFSMNMLGR